MINDHLEAIRAASIGIHLNNITISSILLADDTLVVGSTIRDVQTALNGVSEYASKWRLKYNPPKSCVIEFKQHTRKKMQNGPKSIRKEITVRHPLIKYH